MAIIPISFTFLGVFIILTIEGLMSENIILGKDMYIGTMYHLVVFMLLWASLLMVVFSSLYISVFILFGG